MTRRPYPDLDPAAVLVLLAAPRGGMVTPELVTHATGLADAFAPICAHLEAAHMIEDGHLTGLADNYARLVRLDRDRKA